MKSVQTVKGTQAEHVIKLMPFTTWKSHDNMMSWYRSLDKAQKGDGWKPENGATFKSVSSASAWLKKLLKKNGWATPTIWEIWQYKVEGYQTAIEVRLMN